MTELWGLTKVNYISNYLWIEYSYRTCVTAKIRLIGQDPFLLEKYHLGREKKVKLS